MSVSDRSLRTDTPSPSQTMPITAVSAAPMPVHTAYAVPTGSCLSAHAKPPRLMTKVTAKNSEGTSLVKPSDCLSETAQPASKRPATTSTNHATTTPPESGTTVPNFWHSRATSLGSELAAQLDRDPLHLVRERGRLADHVQRGVVLRELARPGRALRGAQRLSARHHDGEDPTAVHGERRRLGPDRTRQPRGGRLVGRDRELASEGVGELPVDRAAPAGGAVSRRADVPRRLDSLRGRAFGKTLGVGDSAFDGGARRGQLVRGGGLLGVLARPGGVGGRDTGAVRGGGEPADP